MSVDLKPTSSGVTSMNASSTGVQKESAGPYYDFSKDPGDSVSIRHKTSKGEEKPKLNDDPSTKGIGNRPTDDSMGSEVDRELEAIRDIEKQALGGGSSESTLGSPGSKEKGGKMPDL